MGVWLLILLFFCAASVWFLRIFSRKSFLIGRKPKQLIEIYAQIETQLSVDVFHEVWLKVGEAYTIDPCVIKPEDTFKELSNIDSWDLGKGDDFLSQWFKQEHLDPPPSFDTILDLAKWVQTKKLNVSD